MHCPALNLFTKCCCSKEMMCSYCMRLAIAAIGIVYGALIAWKPKKTIDIQIAVYKPFNWRVEPISMEKEIRNIRIMGLTVLVLGTFALAFTLLLK